MTQVSAIGLLEQLGALVPQPLAQARGVRGSKWFTEPFRPFGSPLTPRELALSPDGGVLLVTNFASRDLEMIDLKRLDQAEK